MAADYRIIHVEDSPDDAELVQLALRGTPYCAALTRVETEAEYAVRIEESVPDLVLCDYELPRFGAARALDMLVERNIDAPFIVVSHHIGETEAVIAMQQGAADYLSKRNLERLPKAIAAALEHRDVRREKQRALEALRESESMRRGILDSLLSLVALLDGDGAVLAVNRAWEEFDTTGTSLGISVPRPGANYFDALAQALARGNAFARDLISGIKAVSARQRVEFSLECQIQVGSMPRWYWARAKPLTGSESGVVLSYLDITDRVVAHLALQDAHRRMRALSTRILAVQEEERRVISRELHDDVGQTLGALKIGLHRLSRGRAESMPALIGECEKAADSALDKLRQIAHDMRPPQLEQLGLEEALKWLARRQHAVTGVEVRVASRGLGGDRPSACLESACYRIVQEALNNAARHAQATLVQVRLEADGRLLKLSVHDDGIGFDEACARSRTLQGGGLGLIGMEERAQLAGGRVKIRSVAGGGTTVSAVFPFPQPAGPSALQSVEIEA